MMNDSAIYVKDLVKHYGANNAILKTISMHVERGTIYGLLGASGCGKTTLLNCILGRKRVESGEIWILNIKQGDGVNKVPGTKIGYMPQELALIQDFTISDTMNYFGKIFNMKIDEIKIRFEELQMLFEFPPGNRFLKDCSGGQQRRVSLAVALLHRPELLILDEPTVGLDPILREKIWDFLENLATTEKTTVIITTHYIEECKRANKVGLLRNGKLLAQKSPNSLMQQYHTDNLQMVLLALSEEQENGGVVEGENTTVLPITSSMESCAIDYQSKSELITQKSKPKTLSKSSLFSNLSSNRMKSLIIKNWKQFYRNIGGIIFFIIFPILELWIFFLSIGNDPRNLHLGIINEESTPLECSNINWNSTALLHNSDMDCRFANLSCRFLTYLNHPMIHMVPYTSLPEALEDIKRGQTIGSLYFPSNFSMSLEKRHKAGRKAEKWDIDFGEIKAYMDMSNSQTGAMLKQKLIELYFDFERDLLNDCKLPKELLEFPYKRTYLFGDNNQSMTVYMTPAMAVLLQFLMGATMTSQILIRDKSEGIWDRSIVAGVSSIEITLAHLIFEGATMLLQSMEIIVMVFFVLKINIVGSLFIIFLICYVSGICGMAYGFLVSSICETFTGANITCTGGFLPITLLSGMLWPIECMPNILRIISLSLPCTLIIQSFRNVMAKGWSIWNLRVFNGISINIVWTIVFVVITLWIMKPRKY